MATISTRADSRDQPWPLRPWIMAALCSFAATVFYYLGERISANRGGDVELVAASFVAVATAGFVLTVEPRRWWWSAVFALLWGLAIGLVGLSTRSYNQSSTLFEWPFLSAIVAVLIAAPLFQSARDEGEWRFPSARAHGHAWTDAVIGAASFAFVGIAFALAWLIAGLFNLIGIKLLVDLLEWELFAAGLAGFAFGAAIGILRERDALVGTLQRLVMVVLGVLAPILAVALVIFLASLPLTGLAGLWDGWISAAALTLAAAAGCYLLLNAAIGLGNEDRPVHPVLRWAALTLALVVLPLTALAMAALLIRVGQYGWTPERLWGVVCAGVGLAYGLAGWWAVWRGRADFAGHIRTLQTRLALGVCALALVLALPIVDFGAISARDQLARLNSGRVSAAAFDWRAMAFDFGPQGRTALQRIARSGPMDQRPSAEAALRARTRYDAPEPGNGRGPLRPLAERLRVVPGGRPLPAEVVTLVETSPWLCSFGSCVALWIDDDRIALVGQARPDAGIDTNFVARDNTGTWVEGDSPFAAREQPGVDLSRAEVRIGEQRQRVIRVNGVPVRVIADRPAP